MTGKENHKKGRENALNFGQLERNKVGICRQRDGYCTVESALERK
jgi:hypothetical protein